MTLRQAYETAIRMKGDVALPLTWEEREALEVLIQLAERKLYR